MKRVIAFILICVMVAGMLPQVAFAGQEQKSAAAQTAFAGKKVSILSHSASTYAGVSNNATDNATIGNNDVYYTAGRHGVYQKDTWWQQVIDALDMELLVNNSWSGSCVFMPRKGADSVGYGERAVNLHNNEGEEPDIIFVYLGCNDFAYYKDSFGTADTVDYAALIQENSDGSFSYSEPQTTCEAYAIMLHKLENRYKKAQVYCMTSTARRDPDYADNYADTGQPTQYSAQLHKVAAHFGFPVIDLESCISKEAEIFDTLMGDKRAHPNALGMDRITNAVLSVMLEKDSEICHVTAEKGVVAEQAVLLGGSYSAQVTLPAGYRATVTMGGKDITNQAYTDGKVTIAKVTGDITVGATIQKTPQNYSWRMENGVLASVGEDNNPLLKRSGTITDGVLENSRYALPIYMVLKHDRPWKLEWEFAGDWRGAILSSDPAVTPGMTYLSRTKGGQLCVGTWTGEQYNNYGVDLSGLDDQNHTYRLENRLAADGSNMVYLIVDGEEIGAMNRFYIGSNSQNTTADWVSGKDFVFSHIGMEEHPLKSCKLVQLEVEECVHAYEAGTCKYCEKAQENLWEGKHAVFVGDSITAGSGTTKKYYEYLEQDFGFGYVTGMGVGGSCISGASDYGTGNQPLINRYQNIPSLDLIVIFMGTNDYGHETPLGTLADTKDGTFYGALNVIVPALVAKHTSSKIVFVTPLHRYGFGTSKILGTKFTYDNIPNGVGATLGDYVQALKTVCANNGVSVIDLHTECTLDPSDAEVRSTYIPDGIHPNAAGHGVIAGILKSHIQGYVPPEKAPESETEMIYGNKFAATYTQPCRASSRLNQYLKAGTVITLKDPAAMQWSCAKTSDAYSTNNLGYFPDSAWTDKETAVVEKDGWVGFVFKYRDETQSFDLTKPLSDYITIHVHSYTPVVTAPTCTEQGYTTYTCECGDSYVSDYVDALGHVYENGSCTACGAAEWDTDGDGTLEILAIGNSFSVDALEYAYQIAQDLGIEKIAIGNLYIGGCSLATHAANAAGDLGKYTYYYNDNGTWKSTGSYKISTALESRTWDYVSLQQASNYSGVESTYNDDLTNLIAYVQARSNAKLVWHMTWAYQQNSTHSAFPTYNKDQMTMYKAIIAAVQNKIVTNSDFDLIVPNGTAVQNSRTSLLGDTTTRDGYHMSYDYGRYLTGLLFIKTVTGLSVDGISYAPSGVSAEQKAIAIESANNAAAKPFAVTQSAFVKEEQKVPDEGYILLQPELTRCGYWNSIDSAKYNTVITDASNSKSYFATARFTKKELPVGSILILADDWQYRPEGWITDACQTKRENTTTASYVKITEEWWGDYTIRAFNISKVGLPSLEKATEEDVRAAFRIYIPHSHSYKSVVTAPSCAEQGYTTYTCECGDSYVGDYVDALGHVYENGSCTACGEAAPGAMIGTEQYTLEKALETAKEGDTIVLTADGAIEEIYLRKGRTLDLNGFKLTVAAELTAANRTTHIKDSTNGKGVLAVDWENAALNAHNEYLPVWVEGEGFCFVKHNFTTRIRTSETHPNAGIGETAVQFRFWMDGAPDCLTAEQLSDGSADNRIKVKVKLSWVNANGNACEQYFTITENNVKKYATYVDAQHNWQKNVIHITVNGAKNVKDLTFTAMLVYDDFVEMASNPHAS